MAIRSLRNKRSNPKPYSPMASRAKPWNHRKVSLIFFITLILGVVLLMGISSNMWRKFKYGASSLPTVYSIEVINEFPHDPGAFTQGLLYAGNDTLYESTGLNWRVCVFFLFLIMSSVRKVALRTGKIEALQNLDGSYFGEGLTLLGTRLIQVTWMKKTGFIYDRNNISKFEKFTHQMPDGWGLATDGNVLFGSDGSSILYKMNPQTFKVIDNQTVRFNGHQVHNLNELEFINGEVWANIWQTDCIARISHEDGSVIGWILLQNLREQLIATGNNGVDVLNGIAWDSDNNRIFVTGKLWPKLYEIKLRPIKNRLNAGVIEQMCLREPVHFFKP